MPCTIIYYIPYTIYHIQILGFMRSLGHPPFRFGLVVQVLQAREHLRELQPLGGPENPLGFDCVSLGWWRMVLVPWYRRTLVHEQNMRHTKKEFV